MAAPKKPVSRSEIGRLLVSFRNKNLSPARRSEIAKKAAKARWAKHRASKKPVK